METVEVIVYMVIAVAVGMLLIAFIGGWDAKATFDTFKKVFVKQDTGAYEEIASKDLGKTALGVWEACGLGTTDFNKTIYVKDDALLNKTLLFTPIKQANLCRTLQWNISDCGVRDDVVFSERQGPAVLRLQCDAASRKLIIS